MTNTVYVIIAASVGTASVIGLAVAAVVVVCRAAPGGGRGTEHYDFSENTQVHCFSDNMTVLGRDSHTQFVWCIGDGIKWGTSRIPYFLGIFYSFCLLNPNSSLLDIDLSFQINILVFISN